MSELLIPLSSSSIHRQALLEEQERIVNKFGEGESLTLEALNEMSMIQNLITEVGRLHGAALLIRKVRHLCSTEVSHLAPTSPRHEYEYQSFCLTVFG